eukprot:TRINITY_DN7656_c0_g1_i1.p1 TRINITY_DN7656_c0_g1~~TRINITY_DN7656_c0_g1_i1.p1  ORF type:complete len:141 (-),score=23.67 TRINITY_DN7656_c0_g1_i1:51-473(-)
MYRSGWGEKQSQEVTLAIKLKRADWEEILSLAVESKMNPNMYKTRAEWQQASNNSSVRLQWDPDHDPSGDKCTRRAIQIGIKGDLQERFASGSMFLEITNISTFVAEQSIAAQSGSFDVLDVPFEEEYPITDRHLIKKLF